MSSRAEALDHLVPGIGDQPDAVAVTEKPPRRAPRRAVRGGAADLGRVIGRSGRTARALRTVTAALSDDDVRVDIVDVDRR
ncbi:MAG: KH domain-containing protein [Brachybacterium sp.]|nr:KH domain-containing protein [Brachybacterium sp.]